MLIITFSNKSQDKWSSGDIKIKQTGADMRIFLLSLVIFCTFTGSLFAESEIYNRYNNLVANPYAQNDWDSWYHAVNAQIANESASVGSKCFQLNPLGSTHSDIRSITMPAEPGQRLMFGYSFKAASDSTFEPGSGTANLRFFNSSGVFISQQTYALEHTNGQWQSYLQEDIVVPNDTAQMDIVIVMGNYSGTGTANGQFYTDDIFVYQELPNFTTGNTWGDQLFVIRKWTLSDVQFLLIQSLQGLLAQTKPEIYIDTNTHETIYLDDLVANHGVSALRVDSLYWYMNRYKNRLSGYVLYDINDSQSLVAASSMAAIRNAVMVDVTLESWFQQFGLTKLTDLRGKDCVWVYQNYWNDFNKNGIVLKQPDIALDGSAYWFRDFPIAQKLIWWWSSNYSLTAEIFNNVIDASFAHGWDNPAAPGELGAVEFHSLYSLYTSATAAVCNVSTLAGMTHKYPEIQLEPKNADNTYTTETGVHYVAFMMSDMDNLGTQLGPHAWHWASDRFGNVNRGSFSMGWGMPPSLMELAPTVVQWWYNNGTENDGFTAPCTLGYCYPEKMPELEKHSRKIDELMSKAGLRTIMIPGKLWPTDMTYNNYYPTAKFFSRLDSIRGMFYMDVNGDYARYAGRILWFDGKPLVTCRYTMWDGGQYEGISRTPAQMAATLNSLPRNPANTDSYSFVIIHAWSYGLDDVKEVVDNLDANVRVVTPDELIEQIYINLTPCQTAPLRTDFNNDCNVDLNDYSNIAAEWMKAENVYTDLNYDNAVNNKDMMRFAEDWLK